MNQPPQLTWTRSLDRSLWGGARLALLVLVQSSPYQPWLYKTPRLYQPNATCIWSFFPTKTAFLLGKTRTVNVITDQIVIIIIFTKPEYFDHISSGSLVALQAGQMHTMHI